MAFARPSARSTPSRRRSTFWRRRRLLRMRPPTRSQRNSASGGLDVVAQRFLLGLVFVDPALDDVADRDQPDHLAVLDHGQMPELAERHHFHDAADGVGLPATDDLARHAGADGLVQHFGATLAEHADDITLGQDAFETALAQDK